MKVQTLLFAGALASMIATGCGRSQSCTSAVETLGIVETRDSMLQGIVEDVMDEAAGQPGFIDGLVIVMDVETGDLKAMTSERQRSDTIIKSKDLIQSSMKQSLPPADINKIASLMVALEDGKVTMDMMVDTDNGERMFYGQQMKDDVRGLGIVDLRTILLRNSSVGFANAMEQAYSYEPEKLVEGLERVGMVIPLKCERYNSSKRDMDEMMEGEGIHPAWKAVGYQSWTSSMHTCAFFNGIANGGRMVAPRDQVAILKDSCQHEALPIVLREQMCQAETLEKVQDILSSVIGDEQGLGREAQCNGFRTSGFASTVTNGKNSDGSAKSYMLTFCGYFPSDNPRYTCLVGLHTKERSASGWSQTARMFKQIAEGIMERRN